MRGSVLSLLATLALSAPQAALAQFQCGSPVIDRPLNDGSPGLVYIYRGGTQPLIGPGRIESWSFFNNEAVGAAKVTPLIFERLAGDSWKVVAVGTSRSATNAGVQTHDFAELVGSATLSTGKQYTVGFTHRSYSLSGQTLVPGAAHTGVVDFTGYGVFTDAWSYASAIPALGKVYGDIGSPVDLFGLTGRTYSAEFYLAGVYSVPGCHNNPAQLSLPVNKLSPGSSTQLTLNSPTLDSGVAFCLAGGFGIDSLGCGTFLPGIGELLPNSVNLVILTSTGLAGGIASLPLTVPNQPGLIGKQVMLQGLARGLLGGSDTLVFSNGQLVTIAP